MSDNLTYGDIPPQIQQYLARPGVNKQKALEWFNLGISEPQTYNQAKLLAEAVGNSPEQAKVVAGQWQLESGGGASVGANYNYFGIKSHDKATRDKLSARGITVAAGADTETGEVLGGKKVKQQSSFMEFPSSFDAFQAHRVFLETNPRYEGALAAETAKDFALGLEAAGYATAPNYGSTLYNNYVAPKEKRPASGDTRPASLGKTKSKLGTSLPDQQPIVLPTMLTKSPELITDTLGVRPEISTSPSQTNYIPENSAPIVMPESQAMKLNTPAGWFGSGKSIFADGGHLYPDGGGMRSSSGYAASRNPNAWRLEYAPASYNYNDYLNSIGYRVGANTPNVFPNISGKKSSKIDAKFPASIDVFQDYHDSSRAFEKDPTKYNIPGEYINVQSPDSTNPYDVNYVPYERGIRPANLGIEGRFGVHGLPGSANTEGSKLNVRVEGMAGYSKHKKGYAGFETGVDWKYSKKDPGNLNGMLNTKLGAGWPVQVMGKSPYSLMETYAPNVPENVSPADIYKYEKQISDSGGSSRVQMGPKFTAQADFTASKGPLRGAQIGARGSALFDYGSGENTYHSLRTMNPDPTAVLGQSGNVDFKRKQPILNAEIFGSYPIKAAAQKLSMQDKIAAAKEKDDKIFNDVNISGPSGNMGIPSFNKTTAPINTMVGNMPGFSPESNFPVSEEFTQQRYNTNPMMEYAKGGGIHINPAHEGDFTAKANRAGMGVQEFASKVLSAPEGQYDPSTRRQANFAHNAASWNHAMGGNMYANGGSFNNKGFRSLPTNVQNKIKSNSFADGGSMGQLTEFNGGGTHEENPLGGIPQGTAPDGAANLVESGETKLNAENYIFSDQIKITKDIAKEFNLSEKLVGKTYAEASKKVNYSDSRREPGYDTIQDNSSKKNLDTLMQGQELQKQMEVQKKLDEIQSLDPNALAQIAQSYQPQGMPPQGGAPQGMEQGMPQGQPSPEEMAMMQQGQGQPPMDPAMMEQMMAQQGGQPITMQYGGPMSYKCGGNMYDFGGTMRTIGSGAYGVGEGLLDTLTMGATDTLTDKGYEALNNIGNLSDTEKEKNASVRGFSNAAGAIGGAVLTGGATTGAAISEGSEGLATGLTNLKGTNEKFDNIANSLGQVGSIAGGFVGGNPSEAMGAMAGSKGANALMQLGSNPMVGNISKMGEMASNFADGGHLYPTNYPTYKNNAGPMGQPLANLYTNGGIKEENIYSPDPNSLITNETLMQEELDARDYLASLQTPKNLNTPIEGFKTDQTGLDMPSGYTENLGSYAANIAPLAYNAYQGFLAKKALLPSIESMTASYEPYKQNIAPQLTAADRFLATSQRAAKDAAPGGGAYLSNMQNAANQYRDYVNEVTTGRENAYGLAKQEADKYKNKNKVDATMARWQLEAQMRAARQEHQKEALAGIKSYSDAQKQNALASDFNTMAGEGNYSYVYTPYLKSLLEKNKGKKSNKEA